MKTIILSLEEQVPNIETCEKLQEVLKEFEVEILSEFIYADHKFGYTSDHVRGIFRRLLTRSPYNPRGYKDYKILAPAPLLTELWRLLPYDIETKDGIDWETKELSWLSVGYTNLIHFANKTNIAQATAELLIWVAESHPEQLKQHLEVL